MGTKKINKKAINNKNIYSNNSNSKNNNKNKSTHSSLSITSNFEAIDKKASTTGNGHPNDKTSMKKKNSLFKSNGNIVEDKELSIALLNCGYRIKHMVGDGNCLFRSIADQLR